MSLAFFDTIEVVITSKPIQSDGKNIFGADYNFLAESKLTHSFSDLLL